MPAGAEGGESVLDGYGDDFHFALLYLLWRKQRINLQTGVEWKGYEMRGLGKNAVLRY